MGTILGWIIAFGAAYLLIRTSGLFRSAEYRVPPGEPFDDTKESVELFLIKSDVIVFTEVLEFKEVGRYYFRRIQFEMYLGDSMRWVLALNSESDGLVGLKKYKIGLADSDIAEIRQTINDYNP